MNNYEWKFSYALENFTGIANFRGMVCQYLKSKINDNSGLYNKNIGQVHLSTT